MRVTCAVREYVKKAVLAKVADRLKAAEDAAAGARASRDDRIAKAEELCRKLCAEAQAKFAKEVKRLLGLTFIPDSYNSRSGEVKEGGNLVVTASVDCDDFVETATRNGMAAKCNPSAGREEFYKLVDEPQRIRDAADAAADRLLFELEIGKVAKKELDETLKGMTL